MYERILESLDTDFVYKLFGALDGNVHLIEKAFSVRLANKEQGITIVGDDEGMVEYAAIAVTQLAAVTKLNDSIDENSIDYVISMIKDNKIDELDEAYNDCICLTNKGKPIKARTVGQKKYVKEIQKNNVVLCVGPAGTGKTFLAVALAVTALKQKQINRIVLTRPAVEAGEKLGFLPGDLQSKIDPYLRPLYDALSEMLGGETFRNYVEKGTIEIAPLAYMRGRTLDDAFIILDDARADEDVFDEAWKQLEGYRYGRRYTDRPPVSQKERTCGGYQDTRGDRGDLDLPLLIPRRCSSSARTKDHTCIR